ncbi:hypothetical protein G7Y79_00011g029600 [Physcia stellaris]|nr:hypothetical protein G7Y79_00011g029600 [Physcia stellaris]
MALKYAFFWILPLISAFTWLDVGAQGLKPLFIAGACVTTIFLDLAFASERYLRHTGRLAKNLNTTEKALSTLSIVFAVVGTCGLILLSIFDTVHHPRLHDGFLLLFMGGYVISAIFVCAEYQRLGVHFRQHRVLRVSFWVKLAFILVEVALGVVFAVTTFTKHQNVAAIFEWVIALIFTCYVLTYFVDLLPAWHAKQQVSNLEMGHYDGADDHNGTNYADYRGQYEAQGPAAVAQPVLPATEHATSTMTSTLTSFTNGSAGYPRTGVNRVVAADDGEDTAGLMMHRMTGDPTTATAQK